MELPFLGFPVFSLLLLLSFTLVMVMNIKNKSKSPKLPPGPWKLPIIGNMHQMMMIGDLPHRALRRLSNIHGPMMHLQLGELSCVVMSSPEMAIEILKTHDAIFTSRPPLYVVDVMSYGSKGIISGTYWRQLRKICTEKLLSTAPIKSFRYVREEEVSAFIKLISSSAGKPFNLTKKVVLVNSNIISRAAFGKQCEGGAEFISIIQEVITLMGGYGLADLFPSIELLKVITGLKGKVADLHKKADTILETIITDHRQLRVKTTSSGEADEDLVDGLLKYVDGVDKEFQLTTDHVKAVITDIFLAGTDASSTTLEWVMAELIKNPSVMARAQAEVRQVFDIKGQVDETDFHKLDYLKLVIKEVLRLHPIGPLLLPRECGERCEINGYEIPVKTKVIVNAWALGRDPNYWKDPDTFNPERFVDCSTDFRGKSFEFLPFGAGRRVCPGITFGVASLEHNLSALLYHFDWTLPGGGKHEDIDMTEKFGVSVRMKQDLVLIPLARPE